MSFPSWIDQQIADAEQRGVFTDLPGKGKPLNLKPTGGDYGEAWVRDYARREGVQPDEFLPTPLKLRREIEALTEEVGEFRSEAGGPRGRGGHQPAHRRVAAHPRRPAHPRPAGQRRRPGRPLARRQEGTPGVSRADGGSVDRSRERRFGCADGGAGSAAGRKDPAAELVAAPTDSVIIAVGAANRR